MKKDGKRKYNHNKLTEDQMLELINRRRRQILVHSAIYYRFDRNIVSDDKFDDWCWELIHLQEHYPEQCAKVPYHKEMIHMGHASGFDIPYNDPRIVAKASYLLDLEDEKKYKK